VVQALREDRGPTVVLVTLDASIAARADRIVGMLDGRLVGEEAPRETRAVTGS